ncbi:MAG: zinc-ribbon domain-containing protein [Clostridia bacterium]|nr:zinc-ribbon domain-containing protein [Clostridia bacterium]
MKFCSKCGNQMADDMLFCQKCGTKSVVNESATKDEVVEKRTINEPISKINTSPYVSASQKSNVRTSMKVWMIICFVFGGIYALISLAEPAILGMTLFCVILGIMFLCLAKTPKGSMYMFGKENGIKKNIFVLICIIVAFVSFGAIMSTMDTPTETNTTTVSTQNQGDVADEKGDVPAEEKKQEKVSLTDIEKWYKNEMPAVSQSLIEYSNSVKGISNMNVTESKFRFGEEDGWYDCHYTYYFTCKVNGQKCTGEARAFRKYNDSNIDWFHFEIARESDWATIVEEYDESSDATIENYYKELISQYK